MEHNICTFIGKNNVIEKFANNWMKSKVISLTQGYSMFYLTDELFDDITELSNRENNLDCTKLIFFTTDIYYLMEYYSFHAQIAYIETDYFGG